MDLNNIRYNVNNQVVQHKVTKPNRHFDTREGALSSMTFSDLESTRIDFEEQNTTQIVLESDNNSDIAIDEHHKLVPEGNDFKIVFISSESKSGSELNSSMEGSDHTGTENTNQTKENTTMNMSGEFIDDEWDTYKKNNNFNNIKSKVINNRNVSTASPNQTKQKPKWDMEKLRKTLPNKASPKSSGISGSGSGSNDSSLEHSHGSPATFMLDDFSYTGISDGETKHRHDSSPSIRTITTNATRDSSSVMSSPQIPKIHNIHIRRELYCQSTPPPRPRSAMSNATICSETSQDIEVQN